MKIWKISQDKNIDYDTYDSAVVIAATEDEAKLTHPSGYLVWNGLLNYWCCNDGTKVRNSEWTNPKYVKVELIGEAAEGQKAGVVCDSYNAG